MRRDLTIELPTGAVRFAPDGGGMPGPITVKEFHAETVLSGGPALTLTVAGRGTVRPSAHASEPMRYTMNGAEVVEFTDLQWIDAEGAVVPDFRLALRHEFFPDGTVFTTAVFHAETAHPPVCRDFKLIFPLDFSAFDDCRFAVFPRCASQGAVDIQRIAPRRFVPAGTALEFPENLPLEYGFNLFRNSGPSLYAELFLESGAVLDGDDRRGWGGIRWRNGSPAVEWNFQTADTTKDHRPLQWRNRWGWRFAPPATRRKLPPQHCYQFIDNYRHYPDAAEL
ncbi:MAG: hypothetical protein MR051_03160, partial [Lentisphaeria bacterium]|nr:hypothetical protein [Lentisphaeria bacterium]